MAATPVLSMADVPSRLDEPLWADWLELLCLISADGLISKEDALDRWGEQSAVNTEADDLLREEEAEDDELRDLDAPVGSVAEQRRLENRRLRIDSAFLHLEYRQRTYGGSYPFKVGPHGTTLCLRPWTSARRFYIALLCAASRDRFQRASDRKRLDQSFEQLGAEALRHWLPGKPEVHVFGTSAGSSGRYTGQLYNKIKQLADDINERPLLQPTDYRPGNVGDGGVDVVAWLPPLDDANGTFLVFAQATTEKDWPHKQNDATHERWRNKMSLPAPPLSVTFIPFCFRRTDGQWFMASDVWTVLMDRQRLLRLVTPKQAFEVLPADLVEAAISHREEVA